jgi:exonuclease SbcD
MTHLYFEGAVPSRTEKPMDLTDAYMVQPQTIPPHVNYVAVGHIHKQQRIKKSAVPAYYSGSIMRLDFGEVGYEKGFLLVEAEPKLPPKVEFVKLDAVREVLTRQVPYERLEQEAEDINREAGENGYVRIDVVNDQPIVNMGEIVHRYIPRAVECRYLSPVEAPKAREKHASRKALADPIEMYKAYYEQSFGKAPNEELLTAIRSLYEEVSREAASTDD